MENHAKETSIFTSDELTDMATPYPERIEKKIRSRELDQAILLCREFSKSQVILHDFFAETCTVLWSWLGDKLGDDIIDEMFRYLFSFSGSRQFNDTITAQTPSQLMALLLAKSWRAHSCFGSGDFPAKFSITEDDDKFTFHLLPCASGARLWLKGWYDPGRGGKLSESERPWTFQRKDFPYYCLHCPFLNEILRYESDFGALMWPVDPLEAPDKECAWHVYKDANLIPDRYYERLGLEKNNLPENRYAFKKDRFFSDFELKDMATPTTERIIERIKNNKLKEAIVLCRDVKDEFLVLHDLYVNTLGATLTFIRDKAGEQALQEVLNLQFEKCIKEQIVDKIKELSLKEKTEFLAANIFGTDTCHGSGYCPGKFEIVETEENIQFILNPCGSGGRLIRADCYKPMKKTVKLKEMIENFLVRNIIRFVPVPAWILQMSLPLTVTHFTQRKAYGLGKTRNQHPWSFNKSDFPLYCCQCGMVQSKLSQHGLSINPPAHKKDPCVWILNK